MAAESSILLVAMGGKGDTSAHTGSDSAPDGNGADGSLQEQLFKGSFLGALLFGYPYQGVGTPDIAVIAVAFLLALRIMLRRQRDSSSNDRFTVHKRDDAADLNGKTGFSWPDKESRDEKPLGRDSEESGGRRDAPVKDPKDNAWSRRVGSGDLGARDIGRPKQDKDAPEGGWDWGNVANRKTGNQELPRRDKDPRGTQAGPGRRTPTMKDTAGAMWRHYAGESAGAAPRRLDAVVAPGVNVPPGFDVADFLEGARTLYVRLQQAWADRKVDDLAPFVSDALFDILRTQAARDPHPVQVDILLVNAELADLRQRGSKEKASVSFSVSMRTGTGGEPEDIKELWRFARDTGGDGMWKLEAIEQP